MVANILVKNNHRINKFSKKFLFKSYHEILKVFQVCGANEHSMSASNGFIHFLFLHASTQHATTTTTTTTTTATSSCSQHPTRPFNGTAPPGQLLFDFLSSRMPTKIS